MTTKFINALNRDRQDQKDLKNSRPEPFSPKFSVYPIQKYVDNDHLFATRIQRYPSQITDFSYIYYNKTMTLEKNEKPPVHIQPLSREYNLDKHFSIENIRPVDRIPDAYYQFRMKGKTAADIRLANLQQESGTINQFNKLLQNEETGESMEDITTNLNLVLDEVRKKRLGNSSSSSSSASASSTSTFVLDSPHYKSILQSNDISDDDDDEDDDDDIIDNSLFTGKKEEEKEEKEKEEKEEGKKEKRKRKEKKEETEEELKNKMDHYMQFLRIFSTRFTEDEQLIIIHMLKKNKTTVKINESELPYFKRLLKNGLGQKNRAEIKKLKLEREHLENEEFAKKTYNTEPLLTPIKKEEKTIYDSPLDPSIMNY